MHRSLEELLFYPFDENQLNEIYEAPCLFINSLAPQNIHDFNQVSHLNYNYFHASSWSDQYTNIIRDLKTVEKYKNIFCLVPKSKTEAFYLIALAAQKLEENGTIVCVLANDAGGKNLEKYMKQFGFEGQSHSKNKTRIFVGLVENVNTDFIEKSLKEGEAYEVNIGTERYYSQAGVFGWNKIDQGSKLLLENIDQLLQGWGADFGCGYGYLSKNICKTYPNISGLYAMDIDFRAVECARQNLKSVTDIEIEYIWCDLTQKLEGLKPLDWVVMNPPFHEGKKTAASLGRKMIETAHSRLKIGGILYIVANNHLPYEGVLNNLFRQSEKQIEANGFKVFKCKK